MVVGMCFLFCLFCVCVCMWGAPKKTKQTQNKTQREKKEVGEEKERPFYENPKSWTQSSPTPKKKKIQKKSINQDLIRGKKQKKGPRCSQLLPSPPLSSPCFRCLSLQREKNAHTPPKQQNPQLFFVHTVV